MPRDYPNNAPNLKPGKMPDETLTEIGRLIRGCAELEDLVELMIANSANLTESQNSLFVGKQPIRRKLEIAEALFKLKGEKVHQIFKSAFDHNMSEILDVRNMVAHGVLLGQTDEGHFAMMTAPTDKMKDEIIFRLVAILSHKKISEAARAIEAVIPVLEKHFLLQEQREARLQQPLALHWKSRGASPAKPPRPLQS